MVRVFGSPMGVINAAIASLAPVLPSRLRPNAA
jgi:hypothetical protein